MILNLNEGFFVQRNGRLRDQNKIEILSLEAIFVFRCQVPFKVYTKSGNNFGHFASTEVNEMKPRGILCSKMNYFLS